MKYNLLVSKKVVKFIQSRSKFEKKLIKRKFNLLTENPYPNPSLDIKQMKGYNNIYRLRINKYRFIYEIKTNELIILMISAGSRGDIYKGI